VAKNKVKLEREELEFIRTKSATMSVKEIAKALNRQPKTIQEAQKLFELDITTQVQREKLKEELRKKYYWPTLQRTLSGEEEETYFLEQWADLRKQFADLIETEEHQVLDYIRMGVLINRNLTERAISSKRLIEVQVMIDKFEAENGPGPWEDDNIRAEWDRLNDEVGLHQNSYQSRTAELKILQERQVALRKDLKGNRDQRIEAIQDSRYTFQDQIKMLMEDQYRNEQGRMLAIMREAAEKERQRLSEIHPYADGTLDLPILNADTAEATKPQEPGQITEDNQYEYQGPDE
jgi:hypothetical protein